MQTLSQKPPALEDVRPGHPVMADATTLPLAAHKNSVRDMVGRAGGNPTDSCRAAKQDSYNLTAEEHAEVGVAAHTAASNADPDFRSEQPVANIKDAAAYLAINILNSGDLQYAKEAIEATLVQERRRCARVVGVHFPQAEDERAEDAILDIERGAIIR